VSALLVRGAAVLTMEPGRSVLPGCDVLARDGVIEAVRPGLPAEPGAEVLDADGLVCLPGLVNAHTHLLQVLLRGVFEGMGFLAWLREIYGLGEVVTPEDLAAGARLGLLEAVRGGVTCVLEHQFLHPRGLETACADAELAAFEELGVRGVYARAFLDGGELTPPRITETAAAACRHLAELRRRHARRERAGLLRVVIAPNTPASSASPEAVAESVRFARAEGLRLTMHVAETPAAVRAWDGCVRRLDALGALGEDVLMAHCVHLFPDEVATVARRGAWVASNPVSNLFLGDGIPPIADLYAAGARVVFGTDGAASNNTQDMWETLKVAALLQRGQKQDGSLGDPLFMLGQVTREAARALGFGELTGVLAPGRRADLILVDLGAVRCFPVHAIPSALVHTAHDSDVVATVVDGRVLMRGRRVLAADEAAIRAEAARRAADLVRRARGR
jgi:5-methylthioadenosine/S-adenosylhomocysteine deaminase